jgi:hypothetical protein
LSAAVDDGAYRPEGPSSGGVDNDVVAQALKVRDQLADG